MLLIEIIQCTPTVDIKFHSLLIALNQQNQILCEFKVFVCQVFATSLFTNLVCFFFFWSLIYTNEYKTNTRLFLINQLTHAISVPTTDCLFTKNTKKKLSISECTKFIHISFFVQHRLSAMASSLSHSLYSRWWNGHAIAWRDFGAFSSAIHFYFSVSSVRWMCGEAYGNYWIFYFYRVNIFWSHFIRFIVEPLDFTIDFFQFFFSNFVIFNEFFQTFKLNWITFVFFFHSIFQMILCSPTY